MPPACAASLISTGRPPNYCAQYELVRVQLLALQDGYSYEIETTALVRELVALVAGYGVQYPLQAAWREGTRPARQQQWQNGG
eukprot:scaffold439444_cov21-Prasinocladus_malaysianus.AAC.1